MAKCQREGCRSWAAETGCGAAAVTAASDQFTPGAEMRERWRPRERGRDRHRDRDHRDRKQERLPEATIKVGAAEANIGQLPRESQLGRLKETKARNLEAETVELEQESEARTRGEWRGGTMRADSSRGTVHRASVDRAPTVARCCAQYLPCENSFYVHMVSSREGPAFISFYR